MHEKKKVSLNNRIFYFLIDPTYKKIELEGSSEKSTLPSRLLGHPPLGFGRFGRAEPYYPLRFANRLLSSPMMAPLSDTGLADRAGAGAGLGPPGGAPGGGGEPLGGPPGGAPGGGGGAPGEPPGARGAAGAAVGLDLRVVMS